MARAATRRRRRTSASAKFGSVSDAASAICQIVLVGLACYGLLLTDVGDRLIEALNSDVADARSNLGELRSQRFSLDNELRSQRRDLLDNQFALLRSENALNETQRLRNQTSEALRTTTAALVTERAQLGLLSRQVAITIPARKQVVCDNLAFRVGILPQIIDIDGLLPRLRWEQFRNQAQEDDFRSWSSLKRAFDSWTAKRKASENERSFEDIYLSSADSMVSTKLSIPAHFESLGKSAEFMLRGYPRPNAFTLALETQREEGSLASVRRRNPWTDLQSIVAEDALASLDAGYGEWLDRFRNEIANHRSNFDYNFPTYIPRRATYEQMEDDAIRMVRLVQGVDQVYSISKKFCPATF